jgi:acetolactate synthase-1/2/3 large subunit
MGTGELATLNQENLPVTVLVVTDDGYGMLRFDQQRAGHAERGVDLDPPAWDALGAAFGLPVDRPADADDLRDVLARAAVSGAPRLVVHRATLYPPRSTSPRWADPAR